MYCQKCGFKNEVDARFCKDCKNPLTSSANQNINKSINSTDGVAQGLNRNTKGLLCYLVGWVTGIIFYITEKEDKFIRFHAVQSIITFGGISILYFAINLMLSISWRLWVIYSMLSSLLSLGTLILAVLLMYKAYQGEHFKLPIIGDWAEKYSGGNKVTNK